MAGIVMTTAVIALQGLPVFEVPGEGFFVAVPVLGGQVLADGKLCKKACDDVFHRCMSGAASKAEKEYCTSQQRDWCYPKCF